tara:strand:- start:322 stop:585 length:264 start_codon:yes stop_codon:yes gene_type:complete
VFAAFLPQISFAQSNAGSSIKVVAGPSAEQIAAERNTAQQAFASGDRPEALRRIENVLRVQPGDLSARFFGPNCLFRWGAVKKYAMR